VVCSSIDRYVDFKLRRLEVIYVKKKDQKKGILRGEYGVEEGGC